MSTSIGVGEVRLEMLGRLNREISGSIANISLGAIHVMVEEYLKTGPVRVWFSDGCHSDGQIIFCRVQNNAYRVCIHFPPNPQQYQRSEQRVALSNEPAFLVTLEDPSRKKYEAQAVDISRSGLGLLMEQRVTPQTWVKVELVFAILFGEVRYCKLTEDGRFRVGLRIETLFERHIRMDGTADKSPDNSGGCD